MYKIIGGDGQEYGPVTEADLSRWIAEGRLNGQSLAKGENDAEFHPLSTFPEFAGALGAAAVAFGVSAPVHQAVDWSDRDYELDIGGCISRGWNLFANNLGILVGSSVLWFVLTFIAVVLIGGVTGGIVNLVFPTGMRFTLAFQFIQSYALKVVMALILGPLTGGIYYIFIQTMRNRPAGVGDLFIGFQKSFPQLFLGFTVTSLASAVCTLPAAIVVMPRLVPLLALSEQIQHSGIPPAQVQVKMMEILTQMVPVIEGGIPVFLVCLVPWIYLLTNFQFTIPLIVDKEMSFWTAIKTSWRMAHKHWFSVFGLFILILLINFGGFCLCCVGVCFTFALTTAAFVFAYETIFGESRQT
jgi:hypothetical protein